MFKSYPPHRIFGLTMNYNHIALIIPILATGYILTVYLLLIVAQKATKITRNQSWGQGITESRTSLH